MQVVTRTVYRCRVCGSAEIRTDEVVDRGLVLLAECRRCEHRWTDGRSASGGRRVAIRVVREVAPAA
jgi:uncharacterized Zn finger protein